MFASLAFKNFQFAKSSKADLGRTICCMYLLKIYSWFLIKCLPNLEDSFKQCSMLLQDIWADSQNTSCKAPNFLKFDWCQDRKLKSTCCQVEFHCWSVCHTNSIILSSCVHGNSNVFWVLLLFLSLEDRGLSKTVRNSVEKFQTIPGAGVCSTDPLT